MNAGGSRVNLDQAFAETSLYRSRTLLRDDMIATLEEGRGRSSSTEAHCVSQWNHDFRPECCACARSRKRFPQRQMIAVTATADKPTRAEIAELFVRDPRVFVRSFDRPNCFLTMRPKADATRQLLDRLDAHRDETGIVYCASRPDGGARGRIP